MATVFRAKAKGPARSARLVALKLIHAHLGDQRDFVLMFLNEARLAMALHHRNIVQTFDAGQAGGRYFIAMELVRGCSLHQLLLGLGRPLPLDVALFVGREVCAALAYGHTFEPELTGQPGAVIHRDISPANVLLSSHGDVKLADFGVATAKDTLSRTTVGVVKGKWCYMAPEQARGEAVPQSDVFSLGIVLHEMLAGRPLRHKAGWDEVLAGVEPLPPLPEAAGNIEPLLASCVARDPRQRPAASELGEALAAELFQLQLQQGQRIDPHRRLAQLVAQRPAPADDPRARRMAAALIAKAKEIDTAIPQLQRAPAAPSGELVDLDDVRTSELPEPAESPPPPQPDGPPQARPLPPPATRDLPAPDDDGRPAARAHDAGDHELADTHRVVRTPEARLPARRRRQGLLLVASVVVLALAVAAAVALWPAAPPPATAPDAARRDTRAFTVESVSDGEAATDASDVEPSVTAREPEIDASAETGGARATAPDAQGEPRSTSPARPARRAPARRRPRSGHLELNAFPWAKVYVDGRYRGDTPIQGLELPAGTHTLELYNPRRRLRKKLRVYIRAGKTTTRSVTLGRR